MKEEWKDVVEYEGFYQVSNLGRVRSVDRIVPVSGQKPRRLRGKVLAPVNLPKGYQQITLSKDGVEIRYRIYWLVADAWLGPRPEGFDVCHKQGGDEGRKNNAVGNLFYGTRSENLFMRRKDGTHRGHPVRRSDGVEFISLAVAAEETPQAQVTNILKVCKGYRKSCGGYSWEFIE